MKYYITCLFLLTACARFESSPENCKVNKTSNGVVITCPDGSSSTVSNGTNGSNGAQGIQGNVGPQGTTGTTGAQGVAGSNGTNGTNGTDGNGFTSGLMCDVYSILQADESGTVNWNTMLNDGKFKFTTTLANFNVPNESSNDIFASFTSSQQALIGTTDYALDCYGYLNVPETGSYTITLGSDDGSELAIDNTVVINMPNVQAYASKSETQSLFSGLHKINVIYFQGPATNIGLTMSWQGPSNQSLNVTETIPSSYFVH